MFCNIILWVSNKTVFVFRTQYRKFQCRHQYDIVSVQLKPIRMHDIVFCFWEAPHNVLCIKYLVSLFIFSYTFLPWIAKIRARKTLVAELSPRAKRGKCWMYFCYQYITFAANYYWASHRQNIGLQCHCQWQARAPPKGFCLLFE